MTLALHQVLHLPRKVTLELHQVLHLPRKVTLNFAKCCTCHYKWRLNLRAAPATQNGSHAWSLSHMKRRLQSVTLHATSPNVAPATKNYIAKFQRKCPKTDEMSFTMRGRSDHDPRPFRPWNCQSTIRLATEVALQAHHEYFVVKNAMFLAPAIIQKFKSAAPATKTLTWTSPSAAPATKSDAWTSPMLHLPWKVTLELHCTCLLFVSLLYSSLLYSSLLLLYYFLTLLFLTLRLVRISESWCMMP